MTNTSRNVRRAVRIALAACTAAGTAPLVYAQTAPAPAAPTPTTTNTTLQEIVVTGSRIAVAPNDISMSPITSVTSADIQATGEIRTEDILNNLPQVTAEQSSGTSISSVGVATVSLRGLGSQRTLVLVNGRRMNPGGAGGIPPGNANAADINQIPAALIKRVDVLTGGASAVYGADAVAGVVNFILDTHYEGVKVEGSYGFNNHSNDNQNYLNDLAAFGAAKPPSTVNTGQNRQISIVAGSNFADGKGNATAYFTYLNSSPAVGYQYDIAGCTLVGGRSPTSSVHCGGSGTSGHGQFLMLGNTGAATTTIVDNAVDPVTGAFRPFNDAVDGYNYGALSYFQRAAERYTAGAFVHYDINDHASIYTETMFARNTSTAQYGPSGDFFQTSTISCTDPLLTAQELSTLCNPTALAENAAVYPTNPPNSFTLYIGRRNIEGGGRQDNYGSNSIRQIVGINGGFGDAWTYDAYGQVGITDFRDIEGNFLGQNQITNALNVIPNPAVGGVKGVAPGAPVCAVAVSGVDPTCVPWNIWVPGGVTKEALAYLSVPATYAATSTEYVADGSITGDLGKYGAKLPTAKDGLSVNFGTEYRSEKFKFSPDYIFSNGFQAGGAPSKAIDGGFHVWEAFTEVRVPIMDDLPFAYNVSADAGYRYSSYSLGFNTSTYKLQLEWAPIQDVRLRAGYNRAVRAPNLGELFEPATVGAGGTADPCWGSTPVYTLAQCENTGVTASEYGHIAVNSAAQINTLAGGNAHLVPEIADTYTYGLVLHPEAIPSLVATVDLYYIKIRDTITSLSSNTIINDCAFKDDPTSCALIHRGPTGSLWINTANFVTATDVNIGTVSTRGVDFAGRYTLPVAPIGRFTFNFDGTLAREFATQPLPSGSAYDCVGFYGTTCDAPLPKWRHVLTTNWYTPWKGLNLTLRWRYIGGTAIDSSSSNPQLSGPYYFAADHIPAYNYFDASADMTLLSNIDVRLGVNNIADKEPPLVLNGTLSQCPNTTCNDNTWVGTYDALGRYLFVDVTAKF